MKNARLKGGFGQVSRTVMRDPDLTLKEKGLYAYLATYANSVGNELDVSINRMASECGVAPATVKRSIDVLKKKGIIDRVYNGKNISLKTVLLK